jgi:uncharacterized heparinase superfamily protein
VKASRRADGQSVLLVVAGKDSWLFSAPNEQVVLEESVYLSATDGPRRTSQIVIADRVRDVPRVIWTFIRATPPPADRREAASVPELPL